MSEKKTIVVDIEETERTQIGALGELESVEVKGVLSVNNGSDRSRIWNVRVLLADSRDGTDIAEESLAVGEVDVGGKWDTTYAVDISEPIIKLTEKYDTCGSMETEEPHSAYVYGIENPVKITINIKNETAGQLDNIILNKTVPPELSSISIESATTGTAEFDEGTRQVVWKDFLIYPNEESTLVISAIGNVEDVEEKNSGEIVVTYRAEGQQRSTLEPDMTALTEFLTGIETSETEPNQWECTLECSNESDLMVRLDKAEIYLVPEDGGKKEKRIEESPAIEMEPGKEWSAMFEVSSKSPPKCTQDVEYTPMRTITRRVLGSAAKTPRTISVSMIEHTKEFDPSDVSSLDKTPVEVTIEITNAGTSKLNEIKFQDNLPDDIMPPKKEHVEVWVRGEEYSGDFEFGIDPDDQDPEKPHTITFLLTGLKDSVGELEPGESVKVNYAIMAWRVRPEKEYPSPIHCWATIYPEGIPTEAEGSGDDHKIVVVYKKRRISTKKGINKGTEAGEYVIMLVVQNKGEVTVENVKVTDWIPAGFQYVSTDPEEEAPTNTPVDDGTEMVWTWTRMNPGEKQTIRVSVQGEGEYERREPEVSTD